MNTEEDVQEKLREKYMKYAFFRRAVALKEESEELEYIQGIYIKCLDTAELLSESDGQFTGGYSSEVYKYKGDVYEFYFHVGKLAEMQRFDGVLYEK